MKKIRNFLFNNGSLTFLSIISLILVFVIVCAGALTMIYRIGFIDNPFDVGADQTTQAAFLPSANEENKKPQYEDMDSEENFKMLLASFPYYEDIYAEFYITYIYESYNVEFYRVYKNGALYRIESYDMQNNLRELVICNGTHVSVMDKYGEFSVYPVSEAFSFENQSSLPTFLFLKNDEYILSDYHMDGTDYIVTCDYPNLGTSDVVTFDAKTGALKKARMYFGETVIMFYDIMDFDTEYAFENGLFVF